MAEKKNPEDHQAANRLIKNLVKEEEDKKEKGHRRKAELEKVENNVRVLNEMLEAFDPNAGASDADRELMKELYEDCEKLRPNLFKLASDTEDKDESIADILKANDNLVKVLESYQSKMASNIPVKLLDVTEGDASEPSTAADSNDVTASSAAPATSGDDFLNDDLKALVMGSTSAPSVPKPPDLSAKGLEELFKSGSSATSVAPPPAAAPAVDLESLLLKPLHAPPKADASSTEIKKTTPSTPPADAAARASTAASLLETTTPKTTETKSDWSNFDGVFATDLASGDAKATAQPPTSAGSSDGDLISVFSTTTPKPSTPPLLGGGLLDDAFDAPSTGALLDAPLLQPKSAVPSVSLNPVGTAKPAVETPPSPSTAKKAMDDINLMSQGLLEDTMKEFGVTRPAKTTPPTTASTPPTSHKMTLAELQKLKEQKQSEAASTTNNGSDRPSPTLESQEPAVSRAPDLENVSVSLESIKPSTLAPVSLYDRHGLKIMLFFAQVTCYPSPDVAVMILTTMSTNTSELKSYHFTASASKLVTLKLQTPTADQLPPFNPILPPSAISQVMLLANPNKEPVKLDFKLDFKLGDVAFSDSGESPQLPDQIFSTTS